MNLIEAAKLAKTTGAGIRKAEDVASYGEDVWFNLNRGRTMAISLDDILADTWEVKQTQAVPTVDEPAPVTSA